MNAAKKNTVELTPTEIRHALRDAARRQKIAPNVLALIEANVAIVDEHLSHLEKQERFLTRQFLCMAECPWCDSKVSWFEALAEPGTFTWTRSGDTHECPHCKKRIVYALPFMGPWYWTKHKDDKNPNRVVSSG
jgi:hypothetical protein